MTREEMKELGFKERLILAAEAVAFVEKDGRNDFHKYDYVSEAAIKREVSKALRANGLFISSVSYEVLGEIGPTTATLRCEVVVGDAYSDATVSSEGIGSGTDKGDKAAYKACAGALKYALTSLFLIGTKDDPEADTDTDKRAAAPKASPKRDEEPKPALDFEGVVALISAAKTAADLSAVRPSLSAFTKHAKVNELRDVWAAAQARVNNNGGK